MSQIETIEIRYEVLSRDTQLRKNKLLDYYQLSSVQLSSSSQASRSSSSSISIILITSASSAASSIDQTQQEPYQNDFRIRFESLSKTRIRFESKMRQNHNPYSDVRKDSYLDVRNQYDLDRRGSNRYSNRYEERKADMRRNRYENRTQNRTRGRYDHSSEPRNDFDSKSDDYARNFSRNEYFASESLSKKSYSKELTLLKKIYNYNDKFEVTRNNFDFKLQIYINKCKRVDISSHVYDKKANIMLKKETLTLGSP